MQGIPRVFPLFTCDVFPSESTEKYSLETFVMVLQHSDSIIWSPATYDFKGCNKHLEWGQLLTNVGEIKSVVHQKPQGRPM